MISEQQDSEELEGQEPASEGQLLSDHKGGLSDGALTACEVNKRELNINEEEPHALSKVHPIIPCMAYGVTSIAITFFNKVVLTTFNFHNPNVMLLSQMTCSIIALYILKSANMISLPPVRIEVAKSMVPLFLSFVLMVVTGLAALQRLNIPMFNALRRFTTLITMVGEAYLLHNPTSRRVQLAIFMMVGGAVLASLFDLTFDLWGYILVLLNCVFTASYLLTIKKYGIELKRLVSEEYDSTFVLLLYNNVISLPAVLLICYVSGDLYGAYKYDGYSFGMVASFTAQAVLGFCLNLTIFWCTKVNSPLATSVTGQIKNLVTTTGGYVLFGDVRYQLMNVFGLVIGMLGSVLHGVFKYQEKHVASPTQQAGASSDSSVQMQPIPSEDPENPRNEPSGTDGA